MSYNFFLNFMFFLLILLFYYFTCLIIFYTDIFNVDPLCNVASSNCNKISFSLKVFYMYLIKINSAWIRLFVLTCTVLFISSRNLHTGILKSLYHMKTVTDIPFNKIYNRYKSNQSFWGLLETLCFSLQTLRDWYQQSPFNKLAGQALSLW